MGIEGKKLAVLACDDYEEILGIMTTAISTAAKNVGVDIEIVSAATFVEVAEKLKTITEDQRLELALALIGQGFKGGTKTGADFVSDMRDMGETAPAIITTGGAGQDKRDQIAALQSTTLLEQPFRMEALVSLVEGILRNKVPEDHPTL